VQVVVLQETFFALLDQLLHISAAHVPVAHLDHHLGLYGVAHVVNVVDVDVAGEQGRRDVCEQLVKQLLVHHLVIVQLRRA
jgi:hypothetical protein